MSNANTTAAAIGSENVALARALGLLPGTLRQANTTFVNLRATLDDLDVLVNASKPATKDLAPFFAALRPLVRDARPTIRDLSTLIRRKGSNNDLIELLRKAPKLENGQAGVRALDHGAGQDHAGREVHPPLHPGLRRLAARLRPGRRQLRRQRPLRADPADLQHLLVRRQPDGRDAHPDPNTQRLAGLSTGNIKRCPGAASQAPADGSAPWQDVDGSLDCDPSLVPPGP